MTNQQEGFDLSLVWKGSKQFQAEDKGIILKANSSLMLVWFRSHWSGLVGASGIRIWPDFCKEFWSPNSWSSNISKGLSHPCILFCSESMQLPSLEPFLSHTRVKGGSGWCFGSNSSSPGHCLLRSAWVWAVLWACSEVLELHFIDELDGKQSRGCQVIGPNSCTKPLNEGPNLNVILHLIAHISRVKSSWFHHGRLCSPQIWGQRSWAGSSAPPPSLILPCLSQQVYSALSSKYLKHP